MTKITSVFLLAISLLTYFNSFAHDASKDAQSVSQVPNNSPEDQEQKNDGSKDDNPEEQNSIAK
jgi:hypothetical protein